jgi:hypothetical protein
MWNKIYNIFLTVMTVIVVVAEVLVNTQELLIAFKIPAHIVTIIAAVLLAIKLVRKQLKDKGII